MDTHQPLLESDLQHETMDVEGQSPNSPNAASNGSNEQLSPGRTGTIMSFVMVLVGVVVSIITYVYAPSSITLDSWENGCPSSGPYEDSCKSNSAVLRVSCALTIMFGLQIVATKLFTKYYDIFWVIKFCAFGALVIGFFFGNSSSFGLDGYAWFARITGFFFLILQQIILIDVAYSWNERWLAYAADEDGERGSFWLWGIIIISLAMFCGSIAVIGLMYWQFGGCEDSTVIISLTIVLTSIATFVQLFFTDEGSILTSAIMTAYATYVCYSAITLNPSAACNATLDTGYQTLSTVIGLVLTVISLLWTTYNTVSKFPTVYDSDNNAVDISQIRVAGTGTSTDKSKNTRTPSTGTGGGGGNANSSVLNALFVQVSFVFLLVSGYYAMVLTNWATEQTGTGIDNPRAGKVAMWIQAAGQWIAICLYFWSLIAPKVLTNREF